ncbi:MAG: HNH endonuclease [Kiritimatiellae bacterium]|nr:HNH endonuclease [Kiritimatiellia bacterium]
MKIDDIQIEAVAKNHLWANITRDGDAFVLADFRHPGSLRLEWDGDILWLTHSSGEQVGVSSSPSYASILDVYLPGMFEYFAQGGEKPVYPAGVLVEGEELPAAGSTEREQVIAARVGQGVYRERLLARWDGACAVTGLAEPALLMASHARPWKGATNKARLDGDNGLPLVPNLDKLFDKGYISFADDGAIVISPALSAAACATFGVNASLHLVKPLNPMQQSYMAYHRDHVFKKG